MHHNTSTERWCHWYQPSRVGGQNPESMEYCLDCYTKTKSQVGNTASYLILLNSLILTVLIVVNYARYCLCSTSNCVGLQNSPSPLSCLKLDENCTLGKFFSLLFLALRIIINPGKKWSSVKSLLNPENTNNYSTIWRRIAF